MGRFSFEWGSNPVNVQRDNNGNWFYSLMNSFKGKGAFKNENEKLKVILSNPAILKVLTFSADVSVMAQINQYGEDEQIIQKNVLKNIDKPNSWQTWEQLIWDIDFWLNIGNAYVYNQNGVIYCLNPLGMDLTKRQKEKFQYLTFSKYGDLSKRKALRGTFKYKHNPSNPKTQDLELKNVHILSDLSNSISGSWLKSNSRIDALYQVIMNSQSSLKSKDINLEFSQKFLLSGHHENNDTYSVGMTESEKKSINDSLRGKKQIHTTKSKVSLDHMVSDMNKLKLDDAYLHSFLVAGNMYGMNRDVLDMALKGSTYENKEKSFGAYIDYSKMPHQKQIISLIGMLIGKDGLASTFEHLPFNQVFKKEKSLSNLTELQGLKIAKELGLDDGTINNKLNEIYS